MFTKVENTAYPPTDKPLMIYDGNCGFCKYWIIKWKKISGDLFEYKPYQKIEQHFKDLSTEDFKTAVRLVLPNGKVLSGPEAPYYTYFLKGRFAFLYKWYQQKAWFKNLSNWLYQWIADNRSFMYRLSINLFGKNPRKPQPFWLWYLFTLLAIISLIIVY